MLTSFNNNEDKICLFLEDDIGRLNVRSHARSHDPGSCDHGITVYLQF